MFSTTLLSVFLGPYLADVAENAADARGYLQVLGVSIRLGSFFPLVVSLSALLSGVVMPVVGALADRTQWKRELLALFAYLGAIATMGLYFLQGDRFLLGGILLVVANVAYAVSLVVYFRRSPCQMSETRCPPAAGR